MPEIGLLDCQVIGLDWNMNPIDSRQILGKSKTLQGIWTLAIFMLRER